MIENLITLAEAARLLPGNPSPSSLWRWRTKGCHGVKLRAWLIGGRWHTSREALQAFVAATTAAAQAASDDDAGERSPGLARELEAAGVLS